MDEEMESSDGSDWKEDGEGEGEKEELEEEGVKMVEREETMDEFSYWILNLTPRLIMIEAPAWYINPDFRLLFQDHDDLYKVSGAYPLESPPNMDIIQGAAHPPPIDFFLTLPAPATVLEFRGRGWQRSGSFSEQSGSSTERSKSCPGRWKDAPWRARRGPRDTRPLRHHGSHPRHLLTIATC